jgi:Fur family ferric uptake transcriptional regulator
MKSKTHPDHHHNDCDDLGPLIDGMKKAQLRVTEQRKAILHALMKHHGPFNAEEIHELITRNLCDLATVYRCLGSLEKAALIRRCDFGDGVGRYELNATGTHHHHHHVICRRCKKVEVLEDCEMPDLNKIPKKLGYSEISHSLEFFGVCRKCKST